MGNNAIFYSKMENFKGYYTYNKEHPLIISKPAAVKIDTVMTAAYHAYIAEGVARLITAGQP